MRWTDHHEPGNRGPLKDPAVAADLLAMTTSTWVPFAPPMAAAAVRQRSTLMLLLSATDPLGLIAAGHTVDSYNSTVSAVLQTLRAGGGVDELFRLFLTAGNRLEAVDAFTRAAVCWWAEDAG